MTQDMNSIKNIVHEILTKDFKARNNDKWLIIQTLRKMGFKIYVDYEELDNMPSFGSITRCRRFIQNDLKECLPSPEVDELRYQKQEANRLFWKNGVLNE